MGVYLEIWFSSFQLRFFFKKHFTLPFILPVMGKSWPTRRAAMICSNGDPFDSSHAFKTAWRKCEKFGSSCVSNPWGVLWCHWWSGIGRGIGRNPLSFSRKDFCRYICDHGEARRKTACTSRWMSSWFGRQETDDNPPIEFGVMCRACLVFIGPWWKVRRYVKSPVLTNLITKVVQQD